MLLRPIKSTIIIFIFLIINSLIALAVVRFKGSGGWGEDSTATLSQIPSEMTALKYYFLKDESPQLSLAADKMVSLGDERVNFEAPRGSYSFEKDASGISYVANQAEYTKSQDRLKLIDEVELTRQGSRYQGDELVYLVKKDLLTGRGNIVIEHHLVKSGQFLKLQSKSLEAYPRLERMRLMEDVRGRLKPKFSYQDPLDLQAGIMEVRGLESLIEMRQGSEITKGDMRISARSGDIFLEQTNKKLKYFVMNDDVKMTEKLKDQQGRDVQREAFAERLEGFGQEKIVLSGAPRVVQGKDVIKGYVITLREKMEFIEVDDALSDVQVKKDEKK
jgi:lipopolysaccharide export system protein LptA